MTGKDGVISLTSFPDITMSLFIASLNSGSNGNCYYTGTANDAVLVDAGLSCREIEKRMRACGLQLDKVRAIFISHEHTDHIRGIEVLSRKHKIPVYINEKTLHGGRLWIQHDLLRAVPVHQPVTLGEITVTAFPKFHDAADPISFIAEANGLTAGIFTDIGHCCENLVNYFKRCDAAFLEANYDEEMLQKGPYPIYLKRRISSDHGHLSNRQALDLYLHHRSPGLRHLILSHLSAENNDPQLAHDLFAAHAVNTNVMVASRYGVSQVINIAEEAKPQSVFRPVQMQMSFEKE